MSEILRYTLIGLFFGTFGTTLGGVIGISFKKVSNKFLSFILAMASGLMLSIVSFELVPEACDIAGTFTTIVGIFLGICAMLFCDILVKEKLRTRNVNQLLKTGIIVSIGLAIHNIPEGLAIGTGCENSGLKHFWIFKNLESIINAYFFLSNFLKKYCVHYSSLI